MIGILWSTDGKVPSMCSKLYQSLVQFMLTPRKKSPSISATSLMLKSRQIAPQNQHRQRSPYLGLRQNPSQAPPRSQRMSLHPGQLAPHSQRMSQNPKQLAPRQPG